MSKTIQFKTNLKCGGCVAVVKPGLDALQDVDSWSADVTGAEKTLTIETEDEKAVSEVKAVFEKAGYSAERIS